MSEFADTKSHPMGARDVAAQYAGLETRVGAIDKTVDQLARFVRDDNSQIRRDMAEQNATLRREMTAQNNGIVAAIDKLGQTAMAGNASLRSEFSAEVSKLNDKQGLKSGTLIALGTFVLGVLAFFVAQNNKPMELAIVRLEQLSERYGDRLENMRDSLKTDYVPRAEIERARAIRDKIDDRVTLKIDRLDERLRKVEVEAAARK